MNRCQNGTLIDPLAASPGRAASIAQEALWLACSAASRPETFNLLWSLRFRGPLDPAALREAVCCVVNRHEALRATFRWTSDVLEQWINPSHSIEVNTEAIGPIATDALADRAREFGAIPYDLAEGPLFRFRLFQTGTEEHVLLCGFHHLVIDGTSWRIFVDDLLQHLAHGPVRRLGSGYLEFCDWQRRELATGKLDPALDRWRESMQAFPGPWNLPTDAPQAGLADSSSGHVVFNLTEGSAELLRATAAALGLSPFRVAFAAFCAFLHVLMRQEDLLVATTLTGRPEQRFMDIVGMFVNTGLVRSSCRGGSSFRSLAEEVDCQVDASVDNEHCPFYLAVRNAARPRRGGIDPFTPVSFTRMPTTRVRRVAGLDVSDARIFLDCADRDLSIYMQDDCGAFRFAWVYRTALFRSTTIERYAEQFQLILRHALQQPDTPVERLALLPPAERRRILCEWNNTGRVFPRATTLHRMVEEQVARTPESIAVVAPQLQLTYMQVNHAANRLTSLLRSHGIGPGCFVPILARSSAELLVAELAVMKSGAAFAPIDPEWPKPRITSLLGSLGATVVIVGHRDYGDRVGPNWEQLPVGELVHAEAAANPESSDSLDDPLYCIFTSGSTGTPKGAINQHRGIVNRLCAMDELFGPAVDDVVLATSPATADSLVWQYFWPLIAGGRCVIAPAEHVVVPEHIVTLLRTHGVTFSDFVPAVFELLVRHLVSRQESRSSVQRLRRLLIGGDVIPADAVREFKALFPTVAITNAYGPTEASIGVIFHQIPDNVVGPIPIGRPIPNAKAVIVDERLQLVPVGMVGELCIGGACVGLGYLNNPELTRSRFIPNPFPELDCPTLYRTGDLCRFRSDGAIDYLGRIDHQLKIRGIRIEPAEVEVALMRHPLIGRALVAAHGENSSDRHLVAYVTPTHAGEILAENDLRDFLVHELPTHLVPSTFVQVADLPVTPTGKLDRDAAGKLDGVVLQQAQRFRPPESDQERLIVRLFEEVLGRQNVGVDDHFFDLGGDSLSAMLFGARLERSTGYRASIRNLFESPTPAGLAKRLALLPDADAQAAWSPNR